MRFTIRLATAAVAASTLAGCAFDPNAVQLPGSGGDTYRVHIEFANALNLPARAKVMANGVQVGQLARVTVVDPAATVPGHVRADIDVDRPVRLPRSSTAQLRQNTILGDVFIEITTPTTGFESVLADGGTIPVTQTEPAVQVEDVLAGLATFVQGGAFHQFQDLVDRMNTALPADPADTARMAQVLGADFTDVAEHLDQVGGFLDAMQANAAALVDRGPALSELLTQQGATHVTDAVRSLIMVLGVAGAIGGIAHALEWAIPLVRSGDAAAKALVPLLFTDRPLDLRAPSNLNKLVELLRDKVIPFVEHGPKVDVTGIDTGASLPRDEQVDRIVATLRMIGMVR
ncbi:MlaD family protein [Nocardia yamanashiensis]|uniref:MlaD family protein n=1 Tax=Nocardia yamanashiensis TaxID=209247 RepID=UPI001E6203A2|nr:MlaD family protein [Nocardia yamanashiensis]UGT38832.1 MlaD family protein [Nocardia yamanashiensis]